MAALIAALALASTARLSASAVVTRSAALRVQVGRDGQVQVQHRGGAVQVTTDADGRRIVTLMPDGAPPRR